MSPVDTEFLYKISLRVLWFKKYGFFFLYTRLCLTLKWWLISRRDGWLIIDRRLRDRLQLLFVLNVNFSLLIPWRPCFFIRDDIVTRRYFGTRKNCLVFFGVNFLNFLFTYCELFIHLNCLNRLLVVQYRLQYVSNTLVVEIVFIWHIPLKS